MKKRKILTGIISVVGALLIAASAGLCVLWQVTEDEAGESAKATVEELLLLMPEISDGVFGSELSDNMPAIELDGENYVGIIEVPAIKRALPVNGEWDGDKVDECPRLYTGSIDNGLVIGGSDNDGQFDFVKSISVGDEVCVTDTMGYRYTYTVEIAEKLGDVSSDSLLKGDFDLTLFARNSYGFEYTVLRCAAK